MVSESAPASLGALEPEEIDAAIALWSETGLVRPWNNPAADIRRAQASPQGTVLAARLEGALVATALLVFDGLHGWIYYLSVAPRVQRRGIGGAMVREAETWLKGRGASKVQAMVNPEDEPVVAFFATLGYEEMPALAIMARDLG